MNKTELYGRLSDMITGCTGACGKRLIDAGTAIPAAAYGCPFYDRSAVAEVEALLKSLEFCSSCGKQCGMLIIPHHTVLTIIQRSR